MTSQTLLETLSERICSEIVSITLSLSNFHRACCCYFLYFGFVLLDFCRERTTTSRDRRPPTIAFCCFFFRVCAAVLRLKYAYLLDRAYQNGSSSRHSSRNYAMKCVILLFSKDLFPFFLFFFFFVFRKTHVGKSKKFI